MDQAIRFSFLHAKKKHMRIYAGLKMLFEIYAPELKLKETFQVTFQQIIHIENMLLDAY